MDIKPNSSEPRNPALQFDLTKPAREVIQARQPLTPDVAEVVDPTKSGKSPEEIAKAREAHREQYRQRVANARLHYTKNHAEEFAIAAAREEYRGRLEKRRANNDASSPDTDRIVISDAAQRLIEQVAQRAQQDETKRTERVNELRELYERGQLDSAERIERSARRMLGGE
jgi:Xaa-Pro aminopeptidase